MAEGSMFYIVYIIDAELPVFRDFQITESSLMKSISEKVGEDHVNCIRKEWGIWAIYVNSEDSQSKLINEGFSINELHCFDTSDENDIVVCGLPLNVSETVISGILEHCKIRVENPQSPSNYQFNGNRLVRIVLSENSVPREVQYDDKVYYIYHASQTSEKDHTIKCYKKACGICCKPDHLSHTNECPCYENIVFLQGTTNPLSNSFIHRLEISSFEYSSAEQAYQHQKAFHANYEDVCTKILESKTGLEAKYIGDQIPESEDWLNIKEETMTRILLTKYKTVEKMKEKLETVSENTVFAEATTDCYWGTGLTPELTKTTESAMWPGKNKLGYLIKGIITLTFYTINARGLQNDNKRDAFSSFLEAQGIDIVIVQDTHFVHKNGKRFKGFDKYCHCPSNSSTTGVSILVRKSEKNITLTKIFSSEDGRILIVKLEHNNKSLTVVNVHAPEDKIKKEFFMKTLLMVMKKFCEKHDTVLCGDLNSDIELCPVSLTTLGRILAVQNLVDGWSKSGKSCSDRITHRASQNSRLNNLYLCRDICLSLDEISVLNCPALSENGISGHLGICFKINTGVLKGVKQK